MKTMILSVDMNVMYLCTVLALVVPIIILCLIRTILWLISWYLYRKYSIKLRVNRIGFLSINQIVITLADIAVNIEIECIGLSTKLVNQKYASLVVIKLSDIRLEGDLISAFKSIKSYESQLQSENVIKNDDKKVPQKVVSFLNLLRRLSRLRFISISLHNTSLMQLGLINENTNNECLFHSNIQMIKIYMTNVHKNKLTLMTNFEGISLKLLKHMNKDNCETCLAQVSLVMLGSLRVEDNNQISTDVALLNPEIILYDILPIIKSFKMANISRANPPNSEGFITKILNNNLKQKMHKLLKQATVRLDNSLLKLVRESGQKALTIHIKTIEADLTKTSCSELETRLIVSDMKVKDTNAMVSTINRVNLIAKIEREKSIQQRHQLFVVSELSSCHIIYNDEEIRYWIDLINKTYEANNDIINSEDKQSTQLNNSFLKDLPKFSASLDINDLEFSVNPNPINHSMVTYGLSHAKIGYVLNSDPLFREMSFELLLETFWCWNGNRDLRPSNPNSLKRYHQKHVPLFTSMLFLKCRHMNLSEFRVHCVMDGIQISLDHFIRLLNQYDLKSYSRSKSSINSNLLSSSIQINLSSVNLFTSDLMLRIDSAATDSNSSKLTTSINGLALSTMYKPSATLSCLRAAELTEQSSINDRIVYLSVFRLNLNYDTHENTITLTEEVFIQWNSSFHLTLIELYDEFLSRFMQKTNNTVESLSSVSVTVKLDGKIRIGALLSNSGNTIALETEFLSLSIHSNKISSKCDFLFVYFDKNLIMTLENICINQFSESDSQSILNRKKYLNPSLETKRNKVISICIENIVISFPYLYNFAETFNEKLITIVKWLRQIHRSDFDLENQSQKTTLFPDILLKVQNASMEVADDPFEVQLSDNYELLEDEYKESLKRWQMLSEKIEERRRKNILLPASKLEELHNLFAKQNADTYIERSKRLYDSSPMRTRLFTVRIEGLELEVVADSSYNTYEQKVSILKRIDNESLFPEDLRFSTIWCRRVSANINTGVVSLRDFPQPMTDVRDLSLHGIVLGAEQEASSRAKRTCYIDIGSNFEPISIERSMTTLKLYHDVTFDATNFAYTHGACWEPVLQQVGLSFEYIFRPSLDPSPTLSWWDKMRFIFHGPLVINAEQLSILFHASLDPYNTTELIEIGLYKSNNEWLNGKILIKGNLDLLAHTASKYDELRIVHLPNVNIYINLDWVCFGHKNDHHSVMPCAADKVPEYSSNQMHDSYRSFRSHNLNISASLETRAVTDQNEYPKVLIYNSTLRWLENKMFMIAGIPRLTRRGKLFNNTKPRKVPFGRIFKSIRVTVYLHKFQISYWSSFNKQRGFEIISSNLTHSAEHLQSFIPINDNLKHRTKPVWDMLYMNSELSDVEIWLYKGLGGDTTITNSEWCGERQYFLSVKKVSYNRETKSPSNVREIDSEAPTHRLVVHDLRGAWTKDNRDVAFGLFDSYMKGQQLKRNLSTDALRAFKVDGQSGSPKKRGFHQTSTTSPASTISKGHAAHMLQKLIAEAETASSTVYTEDIENAVTTESSQLHGVEACQTKDVLQHNWLIELINSQVVLRGCETDGYVIVSAAKAQILQRIHRPVWKNRTLYSKTTWQGLLECMQYYATVDRVDASVGVQNDDITWLTLDNIEECNNKDIIELPDLVGSGHSVGGVVSSEVGTCSGSEMCGTSPPIQLQRIVSRCKCQFFYASYGENVDPNEYEDVPPLPQDNDLLLLEPWDREITVDTFTLTHHDLEISTNSQQFSMIMDLVNNLLLYVEPHQKELFEKQQNIRFGMQLSSIEDQREPISQLQDKVRSLVAKIKIIEKESYTIHKALVEEHGSGSQLELKLIADAQQIEFELDECKEELNISSEDLTIMINCFKEAQLSASKTKERQTAAQETGGIIIANVIRRNEVCFKHAVWRLTDADGQLGLADLVLSNFLYTKVSKNDDSVEHSFELGYIHCSNLLPNQVYKDVIELTELQPNIPLDRQIALRVFCRERAPVGGISVKEHLEVNVIPLTLGLTYAFFKNMLKFFFPNPTNSETTHPEANEDNESQTKSNKKKNNLKRDESTQSMSSNGTNSTITSSVGKSLSIQSATSSTLQMTKDNERHIEKMRERAQKNQTFVYIKIPEVPIRVSYKGNKGKNLEDLHNVSIILPTMEYHNRTWTWLDLLMALKNDSKRILLSQALKHKFHISGKGKSITTELDPNKSSQQSDKPEEDEDKARMLLGNIAVPNTHKTKSNKLSIFKK
ncbi:protein hobbit-like [Oppia nitens]|uniref:protein hobbit-like n=1 Tax=Oppia nitens TaxID=1686743 RepID=UPI0023DA8570|nr:protein hobbit-like [Oppia nitens]